MTPDTKVLQAMQLMTGFPCLCVSSISFKLSTLYDVSCNYCFEFFFVDNRIRHIPVIDAEGMIGMVSIGDVVRAVVTEHREELDRLNAYIQGGY